MSLAPWQLERDAARLQLDRFSAAIDLSRPARGLLDVRAADGLVAGARLLGISTPSSRAGHGASPVERYVRGTDLIAVYEESPSWPVRLQGQWRAIAPQESDRFLAAVELRVSVQTDSSIVRPELTVESSLPATDVLRPVDVDCARFQSLRAPADRSLTVDSSDGAGCLIFRLPGTDLSYAEMVHPVDFGRYELAASTGSGQALNVCHHLFCGPLEKGVVLVARLCGVFLPRSQDTQIVSAYYARFAAAEPPLGA